MYLPSNIASLNVSCQGDLKQAVASFDEGLYRGILAVDDMAQDILALDQQVHHPNLYCQLLTQCFVQIQSQLDTLVQFQQAAEDQRIQREPAEQAWRESVTSAVKEAHKEFEADFVMKKLQELWAREAQLDLELSGFSNE